MWTVVEHEDRLTGYATVVGWRPAWRRGNSRRMDEHMESGGIATGPFEVVTKIEAARRQLATAIELCLDDRDAVSTRTLAAAAHEILRTLLRKRGRHGSGLVDNPLHDKATRERIATAAGTTRNFFKHADRDPDRVLRFRPVLTEWVIFDAVVMQHDLDGTFSPEGWAFFAYMVTIYAQHLGDFPFADAARRFKAAEGVDFVVEKAVFSLMLKSPDLRTRVQTWLAGWPSPLNQPAER